ncbi:LysE family translocator [Uruburuella testudinis]|uniref:LysE family translocator n=1 Tax=Uruburuella testudinis TaxID=1282863 RepID=A0ABY4DRC8_9NEIS|nr:LysE family translocator [Uruburuella testudinis]UOO81284.1 LysE family translocator [Uruburuella testudinis]
MSSWAEFLLWLGVVFPLVFSAGPGNVLCAVCGAANGFRQSVPFILGLDLVYSAYALLAGFGLAAVVQRYPAVMLAVQLAGAAYVAWLGIKMLRRTHVAKKQAAKPLRFIDGVISQALNVKGITIILTMYSQFLNPDEPLPYQVLSLSAALLALNLLTHFTWAYGGAWIAEKFASDAAVQTQGRVFGSMLVAIALWLLYRALG